jgi:acetoin utilization deacetylase AcuC-like enzyme
VDGLQYRLALERAEAKIRRFRPAFLVVALGLDTAKGDPTGSWVLTARDFEENGRIVGRMRLPTLVVQEGGYRSRTLGTNARAFFNGLADGAFGWPVVSAPRNGRTPEPNPAPDAPVVTP